MFFCLRIYDLTHAFHFFLFFSGQLGFWEGGLEVVALLGYDMRWDGES
jgi:hypothetical protein